MEEEIEKIYKTPFQCKIERIVTNGIGFKSTPKNFSIELDDTEIGDEILFEQFLKSRSRRGINNLILNTFYNRKNVRKDLAEGIELKKNEPQFRDHIADLLRNVRAESKNGYRDLSPKEQEAILNLRLEELGNLFGNYDIFFSRRKLKYRIGNKRKYKKELLPLRKEATTLLIRCYKPYGLFCEREQEAKSLDLEESANQLELSPSL